MESPYLFIATKHFGELVVRLETVAGLHLYAEGNEGYIEITHPGPNGALCADIDLDEYHRLKRDIRMITKVLDQKTDKIVIATQKGEGKK